jgi:hypothetical protein
MYLTDETFTFNINGNDRDYNQSVADPNDDNSKTKDIMLSEDWGINMGSRLDDSVEEYYCEVIQYVYNAYNDGGHITEWDTNINFTHLYSDLAESGMKPNILIDKARYPLTQPASTKNNTMNNNLYNGFTRNTVGQLQKNSFVCKNFNAKTKYFRLASMRYNKEYGFINVTSYAHYESYGNTSLVFPYSHNLTQDGATGGAWARQKWLKKYPHVIMYMTPIYKDKVPRLLREDDSITLQLSSIDRISGTYGTDCVLKIAPFNSKYKKFKAVFQTLNIAGTTGLSETARPLVNHPFHFCCYGWDKSPYGYGGDKNGEAFILTTNSITFNYQNDVNTNSHLASTNGAIMTINNELHNREIRFAFLLSQMALLITDYSDFPQYGTLLAHPMWEWDLTLRLYGIE